MMNLQEASMGNGRDGEGKKRLTKREIRYWAASAAGIIFVIFVTQFILYFAVDNPAYVRGSDAVRRFIPPNIAIFASIALTIGLIGLLTYTHKIVDEQEQVAIHWANSISWYCVILITFIWFILHSAQLVPPVDGRLVLLASALAGLFVWAWKKYS